MSLGLAARYKELEQVDRDLSRTQQELLAAHLKLAGPDGPRPEILYKQVLSLRQKSRQLLHLLGHELASGS